MIPRLTRGFQSSAVRRIIYEEGILGTIGNTPVVQIVAKAFMRFYTTLVGPYQQACSSRDQPVREV